MDKLVEHARKAVDQGDFQWACQLADKIMAGGTGFSGEGRRLKIAALRGLSQQQINAPAMNYYLSCAWSWRPRRGLERRLDGQKGREHSVVISDLFRTGAKDDRHQFLYVRKIAVQILFAPSSRCKSLRGTIGRPRMPSG